MPTSPPHSRRPWHLIALGVLVAGVAALAIVEIGPPSSSARTSRELVTAERGVVQSTVTGTGNVQAGTDVNVNFKTSGTLSQTYVHVGQHVTQGQLLATLDPTAAQLTLDQAEKNLTAAQYQLADAESGTSTGAAATSGGATSGGATSASLQGASAQTEFVALSRTTTTTATSATRTPSAPAPRPAAPSRARTTTSPSRTAASAAPATQTRTATSTTTTTTPSPAAIASAQAAVDGAEASVHSAQTAVNNTKLYAPAGGTIVSLASLSPGDSVSAGTSGSVTGSSGTGSSGSSGASSSSGAASTTAGGLGNSGSGSGSGSSSSSQPFAEIVDAGQMTMTIAFSESDITQIKVGQPATVSLDALSNVQLAAHVSSISQTATTSSGVVSYDATLTLDQLSPQMKPGMSASATVVVKQAEGVTVPNQAVQGTGSLSSVNVIRGGKTISQQVVVGLRGSSQTQIVSGISAGEQVVVTITLPSLGTTGTTSRIGSGTLGGGGGLGGGGFGGGGGFRLLGGGGAFRPGGG